MGLQDKPLADKGLISYRHPSIWGSYVMIGATGLDDAIVQANRSLSKKNANINLLEVWDGDKYIKVIG